MCKQLDQHSTKLRSTFNCWYFKAKLMNILIVCITIIFILISIWDITYFNSKFHEILSISSSIWVCISLVLTIHSDKCKGTGADIQELFDSYVFELESYSYITLQENYLNSTVICDTSSINTNPYYDELITGISTLNILNAQKSNINYDKGMRAFYLKMNVLSLILYIIISISIGYIFNLTVEKLVLTIILPSISILSYWIKNSLKLFNEKSTIEYMSGSISSFINNLNTTLNDKNEIICRKYQSFIYFKRKNWVLIPNYIYKIDKKIKNFDKFPSTQHQFRG